MSAAGSQQIDDRFAISCRRLDDADGLGRLRAEGSGEGVVIALSGELDLATAPVVEDELRRAEASQSLIVIDLRKAQVRSLQQRRVGAAQAVEFRDIGLDVARLVPIAHLDFVLLGIQIFLFALNRNVFIAVRAALAASELMSVNRST